MKLVRYCFLFFGLCLATAPSYAQWAVFDASNLAEAVKEFKQGGCPSVALISFAFLSAMVCQWRK